ncbi:hypothetical protein ACFWGN_04255 [Oerskovia sp. NPDC060338]|uniref:hypothetical protein n=1 Tax=Oerskovia sp. NPDC060338 TaxID=3347100 RepID=UPI0036569E89
MASVTHSLMNIKKAAVLFGAGTDEYADAITSAACVGTSTTVPWQPISGNDQSDAETPQWVINLDFGQDLSAPTSLNAQLLSRYDEVTDIVIRPQGGEAGPSIEAEVRVGLVSQVGGGRGVATASCALVVQGQPTIKAADGTVIYPKPITP